MNTNLRRPVIVAAVAATVLGIPAGAASADVVPSGGSGQTSTGWSVTDTRGPGSGGQAWTVTDTRTGVAAQGAAPATSETSTSRRRATRPTDGSGVSRRRSVTRTGQRRHLSSRAVGWRASRVCHETEMAPAPSTYFVWVVRPGDTLSLMAYCTGWTVPELVAAAGLPSADAVLRIGQRLRLPRTVPAILLQPRRAGR